MEAPKTKKNKLSVGKVFLIVIAAFLTAILVFALYIFYDNSRVVNTEYIYSSSKVPTSFDGFRICLVTDFHNADNYKQVTDAVRAADPDLICVGGDLVDMSTESFDNAVTLMKGLSEITEVYFTYGNHEFWSTVRNDTEEPLVKDALEGVDVNYLNNRVHTVYRGDECINLIGYSDSIYDDQDGNFEPKSREAVSYLYDTLDKDVLSVMVFHRAQYFDMLADVGYDVVLSGHLHGGHVNLPYVREYILEKHFNSDKYIKGMYKNGDSTMFVCGGTEAKNNIPRIFNTPEIVTVELRCK